MSTSAAIVAIVFVALIRAYVFQTSSAMSATKACVPIEEVSALIFQKNEKATLRKGQSVPQLECTDGCDNSDITSVVCTKDGHDADGFTSEWECHAMDDSNEKVFDQLEISCDSCGNQPGTRFIAGSCRLQYKLQKRPLKFGNIICRTSSYVQELAQDAVENIKVTIAKVKEGVTDCLESDVSSCIRDARHLIGLSATTSWGQSIWNYAKFVGRKVVKAIGWKAAATAGVTVTVAGVAYSAIYCSKDTSAGERISELAGQARLKLV